MIVRRWLYLIAIWSAWVLLAFAVSDNSVDENAVKRYAGHVVKSACVHSRSVNGVKLLVEYDGEKRQREEFINLPGRLPCDSAFESKILGKPIQLSKYENQVLGIRIGEMEIRETADEIENRDNPAGPLALSAFIALIASFFLFLKARHESRAQG